MIPDAYLTALFPASHDPDVSGSFPGSPVQLRYNFTLKGDKIAALLIEG